MQSGYLKEIKGARWLSGRVLDSKSWGSRFKPHCGTALCVSLSGTTPVSFLANEFDVRSVLLGQVSLAAVNQIHDIHEAMNGCKNLKIH